MTYTGEVIVGGDADTRELNGLTIRKLAVGPMGNNAYLLTSGGAQILVDAADEPDRLLRLVRQGSPDGRLDVIVTTHAHDDHVRALTAVAGATGARLVAGAPDAAAIEHTVHVEIGERVGHGDTVVAGPLVLEVVALRGHTDGSVALAYREPPTGDAPGRVHLFTGDSLFPGGLGATWGDAARFTRLYDDVTTRVFDRFDDDTWVYPGHGADTTLGRERPHLDEWRERGW